MTNATAKRPCGHPVLDLNRPQAHERRCRTCVRDNARSILNDPHIRRYITVIKQKPRSGGVLSRSTRGALCLSIHNFMQYMHVYSPSELIGLKVDQALNDFTLENSLEEWASITPANRTYAQIIRGFYRSNRHPLNVYIDSHTVDRRPPPSEDRLLYIFQNASIQQKALMALQMETGERVRAVALTSKSDLPDLQSEQQLHVILFPSSRTKLHRHHVSFFSEGTAKLLRAFILARDLQGTDPIFPNYQRLWKEITKFASKGGTYFKSHHLRKRFVHLAERTPVPIADIDYLMGDAKQGVHCAEAYSYTIHDELAHEYEKYLLPKLPILPKSPAFSDKNNDILSQVFSLVTKTNRELLDAKYMIRNLALTLGIDT